MAESRRVRQIKALLAQLHRDGVRDRDVLFAVAKVPRERFVPTGLIDAAWHDRPLPIGHGQTISQPLVVALMTEALRLTGTERVLEIGTGSGYQTAILCELAATVVSVEIVPSLAREAKRRLDALGYRNVRIVVADGREGWWGGAPYDRIVVTAAAPEVPPVLLAQLAPEDGSRLVIPIGPLDRQELIALERRGGTLARRSLGPVSFVPLAGGHEGSAPSSA